MYDVIIIGGGPAGLTAAVYARRAGLSTLLFEEASCGGQIVNSPEVDNFPTRRGISGFELAEEWRRQAEEFGTEFKYAAVTGARLRDGVKVVETGAGEFEAKTLIIANGAKHRRLDCPGADRLLGRGVSVCAACDGGFFRKKEVAVVGGGNTALEDALYLAGICSRVYLIHRRAGFRAEPRLIERFKARENTEILTPFVPAEIEGEKRVSGLRIRNTETGEERGLPVSGVFAAIGMAPDNGAFAELVELDSAGYIIAGEDCLTRTPGVFAAGDTRTKSLRQLVTAASDGAIAASAAAGYVNLL